MTPRGSSSRKALFLLAGDLNGTVLAHGLEKSSIGRNLLEVKDAEGKAFVKETMNLARTKGERVGRICHPEPGDQEVQRKLAHCRRVDDVVIMSDINKVG